MSLLKNLFKTALYIQFSMINTPLFSAGSSCGLSHLSIDNLSQFSEDTTPEVTISSATEIVAQGYQNMRARPGFHEDDHHVVRYYLLNTIFLEMEEKVKKTETLARAWFVKPQTKTRLEPFLDLSQVSGSERMFLSERYGVSHLFSEKKNATKKELLTALHNAWSLGSVKKLIQYVGLYKLKLIKNSNDGYSLEQYTRNRESLSRVKSIQEIISCIQVATDLTYFSGLSHYQHDPNLGRASAHEGNIKVHFSQARGKDLEFFYRGTHRPTMGPVGQFDFDGSLANHFRLMEEIGIFKNIFHFTSENYNRSKNFLNFVKLLKEN